MNDFSRLGLTLATSLLIAVQLAACGTASLSTEPLNQKINVALPPVQDAAPDNFSIFSFRMITPPENVDLFSVMQTERKTWMTIPVGQLREVIAAKKKIEESKFLQPEAATVLAYETARYYNWDLELARLVLVEVVQTYTKRRDAFIGKYRQYASERATYYLEKNRLKSEEVMRQTQAVIEEQFGKPPQPKPVTREEQLKRNRIYNEYTRQRLDKNKRAQEEFARQAKAAHERYLKQLDDMTARARKKEEEANRIRQAQQEALSTKSLVDSEPFRLSALSNGDFMLEATEELPALLELKVDLFSEAVKVPILPQTHNGRLLLSLAADAQGRPIVIGGLDAEVGGRFDLQSPLFRLAYNPQGKQELHFYYPDGHSELYAVSDLENLTSKQAQALNPTQLRLSATQWQNIQAEFSQITYTFTPELRLMDPAQALQLIEDIQSQL